MAKVAAILTKPGVAKTTATAARKLFQLAQPPAKVELPREPMRKQRR